MGRLKVFKGAGAFDRAKQAVTASEIVCGLILKDGAPAYFLARSDIEPDEVQSTSFTIREGRPMGESERDFIDAVFRNQDRSL